MVTKILHGLDGSPTAFKALAEAVTLARLTGAELHTISVEELPSYPGTIGETIEEKVAANGIFKDAISQAKAIAESQGVKIKTHVIVGHEVKTIIEFIKAHGFELLVLGFMGHSALYDRVMGSTCQNLVRLAPCSVLVVK
jgi:nucleotide-binding universal stress UspA family protein